MTFVMVRPTSRKGTKNKQFSKRIPADVKTRLIERTLFFPLGDHLHEVTVTSSMETIRFSLRTSDESETKIRQSECTKYLETVIIQLRHNPITILQHSDMVALSKRIYDAWSKDFNSMETISIDIDENMGGSQFVDANLETVGHAMGFEADRLLNAIDEKDYAALKTSLLPLVNSVLSEHGILEVDNASRELLLIEFARSLSQALKLQKRRLSEGDYSPDPLAKRFPSLILPAQKPTPKTKAVKISDLVEKWWESAQRLGLSQSTYEGYEKACRYLGVFLKHDDASKVTKQDIIDFRNYRISKGISASTVKGADLAGIKAVFGWAVENNLLPSNPAEGVKQRKKKLAKTRSKSFTNAEISSILKAVLETKREKRESIQRWASRRWVPWICAYTGARVGEIIQLRKQDVITVEGHPFIKITPEAGRVKTNEYRDVPLHDHLIEMGFLEYAQSSNSEYLFMWTGIERSAWRTAKCRLTEFIRTIITDESVQPNHGWRHTFKTKCRSVGIEEQVSDAITGHQTAHIGRSYGEFNSLHKEINKLPRYKV